jgi:UDP-N-acetyl-D-glucosamine dehydrogenase
LADSELIILSSFLGPPPTKPFGYTPYYPGPGLGGHCIPIDPFYLTWKAREYGVHTRFIELAGEVNRGMPRWVIDKVVDALNERGKPIKGSRILVLGIAYKPNVDDMRESPSVELMEILHEKGATVAYSDPFVPVFPKMREHYFDLESTELTSDNIRNFDCLLIATNHTAFDYDFIKANANLIVDSRGAYCDSFDTLVKA